MTPQEILAALSADNITLEVAGDNIRVTGPTKLKDHQRDMILRHKPALMAALEARRLWDIIEPSGVCWRSSFCPHATLAQVEERYPGADITPVE